MLISRAQTVRKWHKTAYSGGPLVHEVVVPAEADGRPGELVSAPSRPLEPPRIGRNGSRVDFRVLADEHGSPLTAVCLWPTTGSRDAEESAWTLLAKLLRDGFDGTYEVSVERIAGELAYRYSVVLNAGTLTEWKLAHGGWLFVLGVLNRAPAQDAEATLARTRDVLATWRWLSAPSECARAEGRESTSRRRIGTEPG